jgi:hypothetical protein
VHDYGYDGLSLDMEGGIPSSQGDGLTALVQEFRRELGPAAQLSFATECQPRARFVSWPFPSWNRSILTEIYLCHACSYHEIEDGNGPDRRRRRASTRTQLSWTSGTSTRASQPLSIFSSQCATATTAHMDRCSRSTPARTIPHSILPLASTVSRRHPTNWSSGCGSTPLAPRPAPSRWRPAPTSLALSAGPCTFSTTPVTPAPPQVRRPWRPFWRPL